jgi:outer membrane usher protein
MFSRHLATAAFATALFAVCPSVCAQPGPTTIGVLSPIRETLASVTINGQVVAENMQLLEVNGLGFLMSAKDYQRLRLVNVKIPEVVRGEEDWVALGRLRGVKVSMNQRTLALDLTATPELFAATNINLIESPIVKVTPIPGGAYLNYDVVADSIRGTESVRGLFEGVVFGGYGSLVTNHLASHTFGPAVNALVPNTSSVRLDSYLQKDFVSSITRLKIGDSIVNPGAWGRPNRFGGIQFGTDYSLNPRFITSPLLDFKGQVSVPSTIDLYVNSGLVRRFDVAPGPFSISQIPVVTGNGDARIVVRDALGKDVVINQPFFSVPAQLRGGVSQYSAEIGALRQDYGLLSNSYGAPFLTGTYRYGLTDTLTVEGRLERLLRAEAGVEHLTVGGVSAVFPIAQGHSLAPSVVYSDSDAGRGTQFAVQYSYSSTFLFYGLRAETATANFRQLGFANGEAPQQHRYALSVGARLGGGSLALSLTDSLPRSYTLLSGPAAGLTTSGARIQVGNITYSTNFAPGWSMAVGASRVVSGDRSTLAYMSLNYVPSVSKYVSTNINASRADATGKTTTNGSIRAGERASDSGGVGYEVEVGNTRQQVTGQVITGIGEVTASVANESKVNVGESKTSGRVNVRGALVLTGEGFNAARPITNTFVLVSAPALPNSPVRTTGGAGVQLGSNGTAVLTRVTPYDPTEVQVLPEKTPIDVTIDRFTTKVTPGAKSGAIARLEVRKTKAVTFRAIDDDGKPIATGTPVEMFDALTRQRLESTTVGLDGLVYIRDLSVKVRVFAKSAGKTCTLALPSVPNEPIPDLGDVICSF